jgi:hypothetical protein
MKKLVPEYQREHTISKDFGEDEFRRLFSCYVESGIPLVVAVDNFENKGSTGHAVLCIGHCVVTPDLVDNLSESKINGENVVSKNVKFFDNDDIEKNLYS